MKAAFGGDLPDFTEAALDELKNNFLMSEGHFVNSSLQPHPEIVERLHRRGMRAIYNIEEIWITLMNSGQSVYGDISGFRTTLQAIKNAGWDGVVSEGLAAKQVAVIREYFPYYINEGGENGENVYDPNSMYYRDPSMAGANYLETYHKGINYDTAFRSANNSTPNDMGMTFMLYDTAELETDTTALLTYMDKVKNELGINIKKVVFWVGFEQSALAKLRGAQWNTFWSRLNSKFGFTVEEPTPPEPSKPVDSFNMYLQKVEQGHIRILFFSAAKDGTPANGNPVILNDLWPDRKPKRLAAGKTGADGKGWSNFDLQLPKKKYIFQIVSGDVKVETSWVDLA